MRLIWLLVLAFAANASEYEWVPDATRPVCKEAHWVQITWEEAQTRCGHVACAEPGTCTVVSQYSAEEARHKCSRELVPMNECQETIYDHEAKHILQRLKHPG